LIQPLDTLWLAPFFLYAETHYRFRYFFSFLKKNEPELISDLPHRIEPGSSLPLLILAKDADRFPCRILQLEVELRHGNEVVEKLELLELPIVLSQKLYWRIFVVPPPKHAGWLDVDVAFHIECNGVASTYHNDNHISSSRRPLRTFVSEHSLPRFPGLYLGDPHTHSSYTEDQVEFGSPLAASRELARSMGLSYFCVTDHSYDLDDRIESFLQNDPSLPKWHALQSEVDQLNSHDDDFAIVRGEEVTCRNSMNHNVHLLLFGQREFIPGSGDGAERWLRTRSEYNISDVLMRKSTDAVAFAAHAQEDVPILQRILLGRGIWSYCDLEHAALAGLQILNGRTDSGFERSLRTWVRLLLAGRKTLAIAGNDAHGNFNRYRQIGFPFLSIKEHHDQLFGKWRTGIFVNEMLNEQTLLNAMVKGRLIISDGPIVRMSAVNSQGQKAEIGDTIRGENVEILITAASSEEFGEMNSVKVYVGNKGNEEENPALRFDGSLGHNWERSFLLDVTTSSYVRVEVKSSPAKSFDRKSHYCYTNPIWLQPTA
jgi:hypothetical protein